MAPDFSGWATKEGLRCADGLTIGKGAFKHGAQKMKVPLVWQHQHDGVKNVLGHVTLEHRDGGVYAQGYFNDTEDGLHAKSMVEHGDVDSMSIFANQLKKQNNVVNHGNIREVSLVLAGANPGALIENVYIQHGDGDLAVVDGEAVAVLTDVGEPVAKRHEALGVEVGNDRAGAAGHQQGGGAGAGQRQGGATRPGCNHGNCSPEKWRVV